MRNSQRLRRKVELVLDEYATPGRVLLEHPQAASIFPRYLSTINYLPRTGIALMRAALKRSRALAGDDVAAGLAAYLEQHIEDELHDAEPGEALLDDLRAVGVDVEHLRSTPSPPTIAQLIGAQYYWIEHDHPVALLGYMAVIECFHPDRGAVEQLQRRTGLAPAGFRQLLEHAELDIEHAREIDELLDALPLTEAQHELLGLSAISTVTLLSSALLDTFTHDAREASGSRDDALRATATVGDREPVLGARTP